MIATTNVRACIAAEVTDIASAKAWIDGLVAAELHFHFEDSPETIVTGPEMVQTFTSEECAILRARLDTLYAMDWAEFECPIGYMLVAMGQDGDAK